MDTPQLQLEEESDRIYEAMKRDRTVDYTCKVMVLGPSYAGKTALLMRYCDNQFIQTSHTINLDYKELEMFRKGKQIKLQIWDTAGTERFQAFNKSHCRGAIGFILVFDLTDEKSFEAVGQWYHRIKEISYSQAPIVLVGNKNDLRGERKVSTQRGIQQAQQLGEMPYFETSAKDNINVYETFETLVDLISVKLPLMESGYKSRQPKRTQKLPVNESISRHPNREESVETDVNESSQKSPSKPKDIHLERTVEIMETDVNESEASSQKSPSKPEDFHPREVESMQELQINVINNSEVKPSSRSKRSKSCGCK